MQHARKDYQRIQDPAGLIGEDEPVFLLRAKDVVAPAAVQLWADRAEQAGASPNIVRAAREQAHRMILWQATHGSQVPDLPAEA